MHVMGGLSGLVGTILIGPRIGLLHRCKELAYIYEDDELVEKDQELKRQKMLLATHSNSDSEEIDPLMVLIEKQPQALEDEETAKLL